MATGNRTVPQVRLAPPSTMKARMIGMDRTNSNMPTRTIRSGHVAGGNGLFCRTSPNLRKDRGLRRMVCDSQVKG